MRRALALVATSVLLAGCSQEQPFGVEDSPAEVMAGQVEKLEELCREHRLSCTYSRHRPIGPYSQVIAGKVAAWGASQRFAILVDRRSYEAFVNGDPDPPSITDRIAAKLLGREGCLERSATIPCYDAEGGYEDRGRQVTVMQGSTVSESGARADDGCLGWLLDERLDPGRGNDRRDRPECRNKRGP
jgi:hypothetical protein